MNTQLILGIAPRDDATFNNFYPGDNQQVLHCLSQLTRGLGERFIYLWGAKGAGISHLLQACCLDAFDTNQQAIYLPLSDAELSTDVLQDLETVDLICLDDIDSVLGRPDWEEALLHLYNRVRDGGSRLIIAAKSPAMSTKCKLKDLQSRLAWGLALQVHSLNDEDKLKALQMRATQRGFTLPFDVGLFILRHCSRDMSALYKVLQQLDQASMVAKRRLTVPFARKILSINPGQK